MKRKILSRILAGALVLCFLPTFVMAESYDIGIGNIYVDANADGNQYVSQDNGVQNELQTTDTVISGTSDSNTVTINADAGQTADVTLDNVTIDVSETGGAAVSASGEGDVNIDLVGDNTLTSGDKRAGLETGDGGLTIGSESGDGSLTANGGDFGAGIGSGFQENASDITVTGGEITANGGYFGAGIGGGGWGSGSDITIGGGDVTANGGYGGAGIGGGSIGKVVPGQTPEGNGTDITISGGTVEANGGQAGAGIGGGAWGSGDNITITGGEVSATGGKGAAGIGGGNRGRDVPENKDFGNGSNISISGGDVSAIGGEYGAGIGGGAGGDGSEIAVSGGNVTAAGGNYGAGIGGGSAGDGTDVAISDGNVTATGGAEAAGIGGGSRGNGTDITITDGTVTANGGNRGAGIGGGNWGSGDNITISGGKVTAVGGDYGAGIGGGDDGNGVNIAITGGRVIAVGKSGAAAIGGGHSTMPRTGLGRNISISNDAQVTAFGFAIGNGFGADFPWIVPSFDANIIEGLNSNGWLSWNGIMFTKASEEEGEKTEISFNLPRLVKTQDGSWIACQIRYEEDEAVITTSSTDTVLVISSVTLRNLSHRGVKTLRLKVGNREVLISLDALLEQLGNAKSVTVDILEGKLSAGELDLSKLIVK